MRIGDLVASEKCSKCGRNVTEAEQKAYQGTCEDCFAVKTERETRVSHDMQEITGHRFNVPQGYSIKSHTRVPGTGEGNDYFGNHT